jgi:hypothetical protein
MPPPPRIAPPLALAASLVYGAIGVEGWGSALAFLAIGLFGGYALRSWRAVPLLACGMLLGNVARLANRADQTFATLTLDTETVRLLGKASFGLLLAYVPLTLILALPVALGVWLARRRPRRGLRGWAR